MDTWAVVIPPDRFVAERLLHHDTLELTGLTRPVGPAHRWPAPGDQVLVVDDERDRAVVAVGRVSEAGPDDAHDPDDPVADGEAARLAVTYTRRVFDEPLPAPGLVLTGPVSPVDPALFRDLTARLAPAVDRRSWLVNVALPIEATTPAEAVRLYWSYVLELGPRELPTYVSPIGDELAMQAYVLGVPANQDPEEDED